LLLLNDPVSNSVQEGIPCSDIPESNIPNSDILGSDIPGLNIPDRPDVPRPDILSSDSDICGTDNPTSGSIVDSN